jgi:hypothetical protein
MPYGVRHYRGADFLVMKNLKQGEIVAAADGPGRQTGTFPGWANDGVPYVKDVRTRLAGTFRSASRNVRVPAGRCVRGTQSGSTPRRWGNDSVPGVICAR